MTEAKFVKYIVFDEEGEVYEATNKNELQKIINDLIKNYEVSEHNFLYNPEISYLEIYEAETGMTVDEIETFYGETFNLDENKKYLIAQKRKRFSVEDKLKERYTGYRMLEYLKKYGIQTQFFPVYDGGVYAFKCENKWILVSDGEFGVSKGICISEDEYKKLKLRSN